MDSKKGLQLFDRKFEMPSNKRLLIPEILDQIENSELIRVKDLNPKRDYIYIEDFVDFLFFGDRTGLLSRFGPLVFAQFF